MVAPDADRAEVGRLAGRAEHDLVVLVRVVEELVVVELDDERDPVRVAPGHGPEAAEGGGDGRGPALEGQLDQVGGVEVGGVLGEAGRAGVLDALVHGQDRQVAGPAQPTVLVERGQVADHGDGPVGAEEDPVDVVGARAGSARRP